MCSVVHTMTNTVKVLRAKQSKSKSSNGLTNHRRQMTILKTVPRLRLVLSLVIDALFCFALLVTL
jgi:hypothetical protein